MTKVISLSDEAYEDLAKMKGEGESFSDVVIKLAKKEKKPLSYFFGRLSKEDADIMEKEAIDMRRKFKMRDVEL